MKKTVEQHLSQQEIGKAIELNSPGLVKEIYDTSLRQIQAEAARQVAIDSKATSLLSAVGLSLTVLFTFGCQILLGQQAVIAAIDKKRMLVVVVCFGLSVGCALISAAMAIYAVKVSKYKAVEERDVFNGDVLASADQLEKDDAAVAVYRRYMIPQLWRIVQEHHALHERKATIVRRGQLFFMAFVVLLVPIAVGIAGGVVFKVFFAT